MKNILLVLFCLFILSACEHTPPPCPWPDEQWVVVGFFRSGEPVSQWNEPIDTVFTSVYPVGARAELAGRRIANSYLLPIPHAGGRVDYVFQQNNRQDTLSLFFTTGAELYPKDCGLLMKAREVEILQESTTLKADSITFRSFFYYDDPKVISKNVVVFVP